MIKKIILLFVWIAFCSGYLWFSYATTPEILFASDNDASSSAWTEWSVPSWWEDSSAWWSTAVSSAWWSSNCNGWVKLNTDVPWIWRCISKSNSESVFPNLMWWLSKIVLTLIMVIGFLFIVAWGVFITMSWAWEWGKAKWKELIMRVVVWIVLIWTSWIILHIINPNFFK